MLLSHFSSELTSCGHWWLAEVNEMVRDILFPRCFVHVFPWLNTDWAITWGMRCSVMFISLTLVVQRKEWSFTRVCGALRLRHGNRSWSRPARVNACVGFIPAICHATSKTVKTAFIMWISWRKKNTAFCRYICVPNRKSLARIRVQLHP